MVARPSLKRVVPGSIPPWRALCAESARALKASVQFSVFLNLFCSLNPSSGRYCARYTCALSGSGPPARAWAAGFLGQALLPARGPRARRGPAAALRPSGRASAGVPGSFPSARACFSRPRRCFGLPQRFLWPRRGFPLPAIKKALSEHFRGRNALGFARRRTSKLAGRCS